ncbi:hypothetical protein E4665_12295 [Sporolactobacillus shoreae]|uniref:Flagellar protein FliT n=1 Tax=Sporolactobacillus shoreae TaxID=1465501 RepID=A0A4Z0GKF8_9BACL|nr:hypothetical protein [Sporolactobacillus shoreae]TGA97399.1 hypothetical protein E4665_12295 [Sporolactobacillus shoreae]
MTMEQVYQLTENLKQLLDHYHLQDRVVTIRELKELLDKRGELIDRLELPCSEEDQVLVRKIDAMNQKINPVLESIRTEIIKDMQQLKKTKKTISRYRNPYQGPSQDGMFLDKRE